MKYDIIIVGRVCDVKFNFGLWFELVCRLLCLCFKIYKFVFGLKVVFFKY